MDSIKDIKFSPITQSIYMKPLRLHYTQNNEQKTWDLVAVHDSVAILLFNVTRKKCMFVKQFRPSVYYSCIPENERCDTIDTNKYPASLGITTELCAGIVDKEKSLVEIAKDEVLEECGYDVPLSNFLKIITCRAGVGLSGSKQTIYYCEVSDDMRVNIGGGVDDELIDVVEMTVSELKHYITQDEVNSPPGFLFATHWFLLNKPQCHL